MPTEDERAPEHATGNAAPGVAPGAITALLAELAQTPEDPGGAFRWPEVGEVIGRFELVREIGRGAFGVVYEAWDRELRRSVAFKLVRPGRLEVGEDQLRREAEAIAQLSDPNLVTLFDVGRCEHGPYLVLELLRGGTLEARLREGPIPAMEAIRLATEIAKGLGHAHQQGVVHRDLKPSNVFLCRGGQVKLLDFGMARAFGWRQVEGGTPAYMAPEQWTGGHEDERTDVYALGVMLHRMLAGKLPFPGEDPRKAPRKPPPALNVPEAPTLGPLVSRMLEEEPTRRPRDGGEVLSALSSVAEPAQGGAGGTGGTARGRTSRRALALGAAGALLVAGGLAALAAKVAGRREAPSAPARAIAVLPFANQSGGPDAEYFSDGLTEEIRHLLTGIREIHVASGASTFPLKNREMEVAEVGRRLRVDVVLQGSVRRERDRLRIDTELIDASSGYRLWSEIYDRRVDQVFAIQTDIARRVVRALELVLSSASESELERPFTTNLAAYDLYLRARAFLRLPSARENVDRATALFQQAIAADPGFAQAHAGLCDSWLARYELSRARDDFERAEAACAAALERDPEAGEVYLALGNLYLYSGRYDRAEREFQRAATLKRSAVEAALGLGRTYQAQRLPEAAEKAFEEARELDPGYWLPYQALGNLRFARGKYAPAARDYEQVIERTPDNASAQGNLGAAYYMAGDFEKAAVALRASLELAPTRGAYSNVGSSYFFLGRFEEAAEMYRKALELAPEDHRMWGNLGDALSYAPGRATEAAAAYRKAVALGEERLHVNPADAQTTSDLAHYHARLGDEALARRLKDEALRRDPGNMWVHYNAALVETRLGETDAALGALERAVELGYQKRLLSLDAGLAPLREEKRFTALVGSTRE